MSTEDNKFKMITLKDSYNDETRQIGIKVAMLPISMITDLLYINRCDLIRSIINILESSEYRITIPILEKDTKLNYLELFKPIKYIEIELESSSKKMYCYAVRFMNGIHDPVTGLQTYNSMNRFIKPASDNNYFKIETEGYIYDVLLYALSFERGTAVYKFRIMNQYENTLI